MLAYQRLMSRFELGHHQVREHAKPAITIPAA
jgi:hypothetical protein